jgi:hypothetical protein
LLGLAALRRKLGCYDFGSSKKQTVRRSKRQQENMVFYSILTLVSMLGVGITQSARANIIATIDQVGTNVVGTGSGTIDLAGLTFVEPAFLVAGVNPLIAAFNTANGPIDIYSGVRGPRSFGGGFGFFIANSSSGDVVSIYGFAGMLRVPQGYLTGNPLSGSFTFNNATFASLGITPGTYTWTWGTGAHADSFTLQIGPAGVPDAGSTLSLMTLTLMALGLVARRFQRAAA